MKLEEIQEVNPYIIVMMPCGFDVKRTISEYNSALAENPDQNELKAVKDNNVYAVDANSYFSKPSRRTITGIEVLAKIIHPDVFGDHIHAVCVPFVRVHAAVDGNVVIEAAVESFPQFKPAAQ